MVAALLSEEVHRTQFFQIVQLLPEEVVILQMEDYLLLAGGQVIVQMVDIVLLQVVN